MEKMTYQQKLAILKANYQKRYSELMIMLDDLAEFEKSLFFLKRKDWKLCWGSVVKDEDRDSFIRAFSLDREVAIDKIAKLESKLDILDKRIEYIQSKI